VTDRKKTRPFAPAPREHLWFQQSQSY